MRAQRATTTARLKQRRRDAASTRRRRCGPERDEPARAMSLEYHAARLRNRLGNAVRFERFEPIVDEVADVSRLMGHNV
jgi:hypothetical protein